ncbi:peptide chain release factor 3 [Nocardiopsis ansamitocini]|uniref:Peptide chain release factor 3 n=1 Tax=Nocardiopsis ansamitocini TaxID=1670832 RepID=A0A9W6P5V1_9ACTN|nr:peptide chain release factor 3 [Nocardiopsis ansamitocini]GLU47608.1 peptide chain release factor 3 [Nocardiopsis ansamitocini]
MTVAAHTSTSKLPEAVGEAARRRTFAVISHPDAGKSTLTEALALHAAAITSAGAVHGKGDRKGVTSDWMEMEQARGISITSAALRIDYDDCVLNLLDTPGHADFSEDTYRVLAAVDAAIMLLDSAKGLEPQTLKLFDVARNQGIPVITFVNKWDRPGREPLELLDEIEQRIGLRPTPLNWPVGIAGDFRGLIDRVEGGYTKMRRTPGGATRAEEERLSDDQAEQVEGETWTQALEEIELLGEIGADFDEESFLAGKSSPVLFGAALTNFGVAQLLRTLVDLAPAPKPRSDAEGTPRPIEAPFSGLVFKMQANMDKQHRDRMAFVRVCSGRFDRGMVLTHAASGRPFATKYTQAVFGSERHTIDTAFAGDVIALVNAHALSVGDTLYEGKPVHFPPIPSFAPEHFMVARALDAGRYKQFRRGIEQLDSEGVVQVLVSDVRGEQAPVLAAVGPLQFDVVKHRMEHEFRAPIELSPLDYAVARRTDAASAPILHGLSGAEVLTRRSDDELLVLVHNKWRLKVIQRDQPDLVMEALLAGGVEDSA